MRRALTISILLLALTAPAYAGDIPYGVTGAPPPPPPSAPAPATTGIVLSLLQSVLALL